METIFKNGDLCYLCEDYKDNNGDSDKFNIPCKIIEIIQTSVTLEENALTKAAGYVVNIQRDDSQDIERVNLNDLKLRG